MFLTWGAQMGDSQRGISRKARLTGTVALVLGGLLISDATYPTSAEKLVNKSSEGTSRSDPAPVGQLDERVIPTHYHMDLAVDPSRDKFSGITSIDIELTGAGESFWLHGKNLSVSGGKLIPGQNLEAVDSGVAKVTLDRPVDAGPARIRFFYEAPFNTSENTLFRVVQDDEAYLRARGRILRRTSMTLRHS
jgi:hypothetical protein